ncbi:CRP/FNR family transcriptional regulator [Sedimentibacter acidaminivorans]|uniref:CRP/FNR family transcriptional regulator n=1 Tax=Sedimentibacter acidaminivorans TaxID=913099 RepID=A0ABS4GG44_9FIRM|nr:Crp/Fnr family transcriptional regulator [Sedimentibacter acidaminivorans]MBP1926658.1 CRP/FNR family transcriptional regulator [Sedimentibacter acidaminivorans]
MINNKDIDFISNKLEFWNSLTITEKKQIISKSQLISYTKGKSVYDGLDDCRGLIIVKNGQLRTYILSDNGKEVTLYRLFHDEICIMSASCALNNMNFDLYIEAEKDSEIILIPTDIYSEISKNNIEVQKFTNKVTLTRFSDVMWIMEQILFMSFDKRLAMFLLDQSSIEKSDTIYMTHEDIAKHMGSAREVVSRMLKYFQNEGYVKTERGSIILKNKKKLQSITF